MTKEVGKRTFKAQPVPRGAPFRTHKSTKALTSFIPFKLSSENRGRVRSVYDTDIKGRQLQRDAKKLRQKEADEEEEKALWTEERKKHEFKATPAPRL